MSTRTRDWSKTIPIDHTQLKLVPTKIRDVREDLEDRLNDILAGFATGETVNGLKLGRLLTVGTGSPTAPGTGAAAAIDIYGKTIGGKVELCAQDADGNETQITSAGALKTNSVPTGAVFQWLTSSPPTGYLICDGSAVSRTTYADLFVVIGTDFGTGNGSTTFNLPSLKGRVPVGLDAAQSEFDTLGETGGAKTHTLTTDEIPAHVHTVAFNDDPGGANNAVGDGSTSQPLGTVNSSSVGGGGAHNNLQPYFVTHYIIKT
jgi:microcystin-dependent protein